MKLSKNAVKPNTENSKPVSLKKSLSVSESEPNQKAMKVQRQKTTNLTEKPKKLSVVSEGLDCESMVKKFLSKTDQQQILENMTERQAELLVDYWGSLNETIKPVQEQAEACKEIIKHYVQTNKVPLIQGEIYKSEAGSSSETIIEKSIEEIIEILRKSKKLHLIESIFKVSISDTKKALGDAFIQSIGKVIPKPFHSIGTPKKK